MSFFKTEEEKKSFRITVIIHVVIVLLLFLFGLKYFDPPIEQGIAVNFGTTDFGSGEVQPLEQIQTSPSQTQAQPETSEPVVEEDVVTQDNVEAPVIQKEEKPKQITTPTETKPIEQPKVEPKPDQSTTDALSSILNAPKQEGVAQAGEGDDSKAGDKGSPDGDPNASSYYGIGKGLDGDGNYLLGGRRAIDKVIIVQDCNQEGIVVVDIDVDRNGNVTKAIPGVRGTTNNSRCLLDPARQAALRTKFNSDPNAPARQMGRIIYRFSLSE
jgi:periplasmic protein TonB